MQSESLSQFAYEKLRAMLRDQLITPGNKISEPRLARQLGISRTPVREAIRRLQSEGLLFQVPQSGTYVAKASRREIAEIYDVRMALEVHAITAAVPRLKHEDLHRLARLYQEMHSVVIQFQQSGGDVLSAPLLQEFLGADMAFHLTLFEAADNRTAIKIYSDMQIRNRAFGDSSHHRDQQHLSQVLQDHVLILKAAQQHDVEAARQHMATHIRNSLHGALKTFDQLP